jgi:hypothetical protein
VREKLALVDLARAQGIPYDFVPLARLNDLDSLNVAWRRESLCSKLWRLAGRPDPGRSAEIPLEIPGLVDAVQLKFSEPRHLFIRDRAIPPVFHVLERAPAAAALAVSKSERRACVGEIPVYRVREKFRWQALLHDFGDVIAPFFFRAVPQNVAVQGNGLAPEEHDQFVAFGAWKHHHHIPWDPGCHDTRLAAMGAGDFTHVALF